MRKIGGLFFTALTSFLIAGLSLSPAWAATQSKGISLTTTPISKTLVGNPGSSVTTNMQVMNNTTAPLTINLQVQTFRAGGTNGEAQIVTPGSNDGFIKWVTFSKNNFTASPGIWAPVQMTVNIPQYAGLGYYYAVLFKPSIPNQPNNKSAVLKGSNAVIVLLNAKSPNEKPQLQVTSFTSSNYIYEYLPAIFNVSVYNNGNIFLPPSGNIFVSHTNNFDSKNVIDTLLVNPVQGNVLPGSTRVFKSTWTNGSPLFVPKTVGGQPVTDNHGNPVYDLKYDFSSNNKFRFGKYYAKLVLVYNNGTREIPITSVVTFWVIPWKIILLAILILAIVLSLIIMVIHYFRKSKKGTKWRA